MFIGFLVSILILLNSKSNTGVEIIYSLFTFVCLSIVQLIVCIIYYLIKIKEHSKWKILLLIYFIIISFIEIKIFFGLMAGFLGDT